MEPATSFSMLKGTRIINGVVGTPGNMIAVDLHAKYAFYYLYAPKAKWFDPYVTLGAGYTYRTNAPKITHAPSLNFGIGFNFWLVQSFGIQLGSTGKFGLTPRIWKTSANYFNHTVGVVYRFDIAKKNTSSDKKRYMWTKDNKKFKKDKEGH